jgi:hypothetical protein
MADKDFVVKNGLVVNGSLLVVNSTSGNVGVGLSNPAYNFEVAGTLRASGNFTYGSTNVTLPTTTTGSGSLVLATNPSVNGSLTVGNNTTASASDLLQSWLWTTSNTSWGLRLYQSYGSTIDYVFKTRNNSVTEQTALTIFANGSITVANSLTLSANLTYGGTALKNSVTGTGSMVLDSSPSIASPTLTGTTSASVLNAGNTSVTGFANVSVSVNSALLTVGTNFIANTTGAYHTGLVNAASHTVGTVFIANSTALALGSNSVLTYGGVTLSNSVTGTGKLVLDNSPALVTPSLGVASATSLNKVTITTPSTGSTLTIADGKTLTVSNTITFTGTDSSSVALGGGGTVAYTSNKLSAFAATTSAELAGVLSDETGSGGVVVFSNAPSIAGPTLTGTTSAAVLNAGNTTITGFANASVSVNSALLTVGTSFIANTTGAYHTGLVNAASYNVSTSFIANSTGVYHTGLANAASFNVGTSFIANGTGIYHTGLANAASFNVGSSFIANSTAVVTQNTFTVGTGSYFVSNGNFGISTSTPGYKLDVNGAANISGAIRLGQAIVETYATASISAGTLTVDLSTATVFNVTNNANTTTFTISNATSSKAQAFTLFITGNGTSYTQTWGSSVKWAGGTAPTLTTTNLKTDVLTFVTNDGGTTWFGFVGGQNF